MSRIRTIKPEFFTSEDIFGMTPLARLFYVSLWCESDREGRFEWKPGTFKARYLPADNCDINELADELIAKGLIVIYEVDGKKYAEIPTFTEHQVINNRESPSKIPARVIHASSTRKSAVKAEGKEGKEGREGKDASADAGLILDHLNVKTGKSYQPVKANLSLIAARLEDGATVEHCLAVIDAKVIAWADDPKMCEYLRPATLFNATKFAQYVGECVRPTAKRDYL